jgi:hypothetical protein
MIARYRPPESQDQFASLSKVRKQEHRAVVKPTPKPPEELVSFLADPPLVGDESREDYEKLFLAFAAAVKPPDAIAWIYVREFADLAWEIRRERWLKQQVIENARKTIITELLMPPEIDPNLDEADELESERETEIERVVEEMKQWETDPEARRKIEKDLASEGFGNNILLTDALTNNANLIDAIDRRISAYENRRNTALREIDRYSDNLARRLDQASSDIIDGEFTEAAE